MTAPAGSAIVPVIVPDPAWPKAMQAQANRQSAIHSDFIRLFLCKFGLDKFWLVGTPLEMGTSECKCADPKKADISRATIQQIRGQSDCYSIRSNKAAFATH